MLRSLIPSMFHRRLLLLFAAVVVAVCVLGTQLIRLTVAQGSQRLADAERVLSSTRLLPTVRGTIYDRKGRVLAQDVPCQDIMIDYSVISGEWSYRQARREAYKTYKEQWATISYDDREELIEGIQARYDAQVETLWESLCSAGGIDREELEHRRDTIVRRVQMIRADRWDRLSERRALERGGPVELSDIAERVRDEDEPHTILPAVSEQVALHFRKLAAEQKYIHVKPSTRRDYPLRRATVGVEFDHFPQQLRGGKKAQLTLDGIGDHIVGSMRKIYAEDIRPIKGSNIIPRPYRRPDGTVDRGGYLDGDQRGSRGVEAAAEDLLRGLRGQVIYHHDTQLEETDPSQRGKDVHLTLDIYLQARIQALLHPSVGLLTVQPWHRNEDLPVGTPLNGSVTVLDVETGDVLAMVTSPADMRTELDDDAWPQRLDEPVVNRPITAIYPPGSTLKPIIYAIAAREGVIAHEQQFDCQGQIKLVKRTKGFRCWGYRPAQGFFKTHGPIGPVSAIAQSCNIYFYSCGLVFYTTHGRDGLGRLTDGLSAFGFGQLTGLGLPNENDGIFRRLDRDGLASNERENEAMLVGIGQGPITATPIQVAAAHAALARGGAYRSPVLMKHLRSAQVTRNLGLHPRIVDNIQQGMYESANNMSYGTGAYLLYQDEQGNRVTEPTFNIKDLTLRSKTGTAQAPKRFEDANRNGRLDPGETILRAGSHSWYVCHAGPAGEQRAKYIIVVNIEYGGSGGRASGPVANQVLHALRAEGYL